MAEIAPWADPSASAPSETAPWAPPADGGSLSSLITGKQGDDWVGGLGNRFAEGGIDLLTSIPTAGQFVANKVQQLRGEPQKDMSWWPNSEHVKKWIGFEPYQAKTPGFEYAGEPMRLLPGVLGGGGLKTLLEKGAAAAWPLTLDALKYAGVPGVAGTAAERLTSDMPDVQPYAKAATEILTGAGPALFSRPKIPVGRTAADVDHEANALYASPEIDNVVLPRNSYDGFVSNLKADTEFEPHVGVTNAHPQTNLALQDLEATGKYLQGPNAPMLTMGRLESMRQSLNTHLDTAMRAQNGADIRKLVRMREAFDNYVTSAPSLSGDPARATEILRQARGLWVLKQKHDLIDRAVDRANNSATAANDNLEGALANAFRPFLNKPYLMNQFTPEEQTIVQDIVNKSGSTKLIKALRTLAPKGPFGAVLALLEAYHGGIGVAMGMNVAGQMARNAGSRVSERNADILRAMVLNPGMARPPRFPAGKPFVHTLPLYMQPNEAGRYLPSVTPSE